MLGVSEASIWQWENNRTKPKVYLVPRIYDFLGYAPYEVPGRFGDWLRQARSGLGLSRRKLGAELGLDVTTIDRWERGRGRPTADSLARIRWLLARFSRVNRTGSCTGLLSRVVYLRVVAGTDVESGVGGLRKQPRRRFQVPLMP